MDKHTPVSRPVQLLSLLGISMVAVAALKVEPGLHAGAASRVQTPRSVRPVAPGLTMSWIRAEEETVQESVDSPRTTAAAGSALPQSSELALSSQPPQPAAPAIPELAMRYIGRMERDGRQYAFFANGEVPVVVEVGGQVAADWKLVGVTEQQAELMYLPQNTLQYLPMP